MSSRPSSSTNTDAPPLRASSIDDEDATDATGVQRISLKRNRSSSFDTWNKKDDDDNNTDAADMLLEGKEEEEEEEAIREVGTTGSFVVEEESVREVHGNKAYEAYPYVKILSLSISATNDQYEHDDMIIIKNLYKKIGGQIKHSDDKFREKFIYNPDDYNDDGTPARLKKNDDDKVKTICINILTQQKQKQIQMHFKLNRKEEERNKENNKLIQANIRHVETGIKERIQFALKQHRFVAKYYKYFFDKEEYWSVARDELFHASTIGIKWGQYCCCCMDDVHGSSLLSSSSSSSSLSSSASSSLSSSTNIILNLGRRAASELRKDIKTMQKDINNDADLLLQELQNGKNIGTSSYLDHRQQHQSDDAVEFFLPFIGLSEDHLSTLLFEIFPTYERRRNIKTLDLFGNNIDSLQQIANKLVSSSTASLHRALVVPCTKSMSCLNLDGNSVLDKIQQQNDPNETVALLTILSAFKRICRISSSRSSSNNNSCDFNNSSVSALHCFGPKIEYALRINHAGRILIEGNNNTDTNVNNTNTNTNNVVVQHDKNENNNTTYVLPLSVWPIVLKRSYNDIDKDPTGLHYLIRHGPIIAAITNKWSSN